MEFYGGYMKCEQCNNLIDEKFNYCPYCGYSILGKEEKIFLPEQKEIIKSDGPKFSEWGYHINRDGYASGSVGMRSAIG
jgi:RNA polymerase subunit RPABC4/transcription elongation factor Spt4